MRVDPVRHSHGHIPGRTMKTLLLAFAAAVILSGCVAPPRRDLSPVQRKLGEVQYGMTKAEVIALLGAPSSRHLIPDTDGNDFEFLLFPVVPPGDRWFRTPKEWKMTPFLFVDDRLIVWEMSVYDAAVRHEVTVRELTQGTRHDRNDGLVHPVQRL
jgi:hypothetical protein